MFDDFLHMSRTFPTTGDLKILSWRWWCFLHLHHGCHLGDVVHDELGGDCLPCPRLPRDDHTLVFTVWKLAIWCLMIFNIIGDKYFPNHHQGLLIIKDHWSSRITDLSSCSCTCYRPMRKHAEGFHMLPAQCTFKYLKWFLYLSMLNIRAGSTHRPLVHVHLLACEVLHLLQYWRVIFHF